MKLLDLFFPPLCVSCQDWLKDSSVFFCETCERLWPSLQTPCCSLCCRPFSSPVEESHLCGDCLMEPPPYRKLHAVARYEGILHDLLVQFKFQGKERLIKPLGQKLRLYLGQTQIECDLVLPVPLHPSRLRERGFNQSLLLAQVVASELQVPLERRLLFKTKATAPQTSLKGDDRRKNLRNVFDVRDKDRIQGKRILMIDDVFTTGATMKEVAQILKKAGASQVEGLVLARVV